MDEVVRRELELLDPGIRRDPDAVRDRLHPDFREVGASGEVWDAEAIVALLELETSDAPAETRDMQPIELAPGVVLLTYSVRRAGRTSHRASIWQREDGDWRLRYHQGTATADL